MASNAENVSIWWRHHGSLGPDEAISHHCYRLWLVSCWHQAIIWTSVDLSVRSNAIYTWVILQETLQPLINKISLETIDLYFYKQNRPGWLIGFNTLRPRQNGRHFADDVLKCIFLNEKVSIPIGISLKFVPKGPIDNIPALVQIMVWRRPGDKPLSEPMMVRLPTHLYRCVTGPQWVNDRCSRIFSWPTKLKLKMILESTNDEVYIYKQRVLMHRHQGWNVRHGLCHIYMRYIYIWVVYSFCLFCCLFIIVTLGWR